MYGSRCRAYRQEKNKEPALVEGRDNEQTEMTFKVSCLSVRKQNQESTESIRGDVTLYWEVRKRFPEWVATEQRPRKEELGSYPREMANLKEMCMSPKHVKETGRKGALRGP